jgi:hypothetical protein
MNAISRELPLHFAFPRLELPTYLDFQILTAQSGSRGTRVQNVSWLRSNRNSMIFQREEVDNTLYTTTLEDPVSASLQVYYWFLPHSFVRNGEHIRVIDFHLRGWLPHNFLRMNPSLPNERAQMIRTDYRSRREVFMVLIENPSSISVPFIRTPEVQIRRRPRTGTPPPLYRQSQNPAGSPPSPLYDLLDDEVPDLIPFPSLPRPVIQVQALPMPKEIGDTLIEAAVQRGDECPILYNKLSDCDSVSITSCFHTFDSAALNEWRSTSGICPCCRTPIASVVTKRLRGE